MLAIVVDWIYGTIRRVIAFCKVGFLVANFSWQRKMGQALAAEMGSCVSSWLSVAGSCLNFDQ